MAVFVTPQATTKQCIDAARARLQQMRDKQLGTAAAARANMEDPAFGGDPVGALDRANRAGREFSLALTALEDATMRLNRGLTMAEGIYNEVDLEKPDGIGRARDNHAANVAANDDSTPQRS
ncbi:MAG TPA: hypothetical protein VF024_12120 [Solirubrobacteraceae bacterium]